MNLLLVVDDCLYEGQPGEFHWRCDAGDGQESLCALLNQRLLPTARTRTLAVYEILDAGAVKLAEFPLSTGRDGFIDLDPQADAAFVALCHRLQHTKTGEFNGDKT
jgi:hypothetical protein